MKKTLTIISIILAITLLSNLTALAVDFETEAIPVSSSELGESDPDFETEPIPIVVDDGDDDNKEPTTPAKISISKCSVSNIKSKTYTGKVIHQSPTVKYGKTTLKKGTDYSLAYSKNINVGTATVTIKGIGNYNGSVKKTFKINPKGTSLKSLSAKKKGFTAKWSKQATQTTGYQIQYATNSKFTKNKKTVTVKGTKTTSKTVSKLSAKKKYYVRVRTYKTVNGKKYYSGWSKVKTVTTKR